MDTITITASDAAGDTASWSMQAPDNTSQWSQIMLRPLMDGSTKLATIEGIGGQSDNDPIASVSFGVLAGAVATNFTISSTLVTFAPLTNPIGTASVRSP